MRRSMIVLVLLLSATEAVAEEQPSRQGASGRGHFGAPVVKYTAIRDQGAFMIGGRGGWNATPSLLLGGGLYGTIAGVDAPKGVVPEAPGPLDVKFESFGLEAEYSFRPAEPTHLTLGVFLGGGAVHYVLDKTGDQQGETDFVLQMEPAVGVERRVNDWLHLNLAVSYRLVNGVEQPGLKDCDINGPGAAITAKLGRF